jgi:hypothetical protein
MNRVLMTILYVVIAIGIFLVVVSAKYRLWGRTLWRGTAMDDATNDQRRFIFFIAWTLFLPLVWFWEMWGAEVKGFGGQGWHTGPSNSSNIPWFTYGRKVISDVWAAVSVVLAALAWNKKPEVQARALGRGQRDVERPVTVADGKPEGEGAGGGKDGAGGT